MCRSLRQVGPLRLLGVVRELDGLSQMPRQLACQYGLAGIDQVQNREIALENLLEEDGRLKPYVGAHLLIGGPRGKQLGIGRLVGIELPYAQPLIDETLGELQCLLAAQHARDQFVDHCGIVELAGRGDVEEQFVRHAAQQEIGHARGQRIGVERSNVAAGVRWFGKKQESRGDQRRLAA